MRNKLGCLLILLVSTLCLTGCIYLRPIGPCYGVGCPAFSSSQSAQHSQAQPAQPQSQNAQAQSTADSNAQAQSAEAQKPKAKKSFLSRLLPKWGQSSSGN